MTLLQCETHFASLPIQIQLPFPKQQCHDPVWVHRQSVQVMQTITSVEWTPPACLSNPNFVSVVVSSQTNTTYFFLREGGWERKKSKDVPAVTSSKTSLLAALANCQFCLMRKLCTSSVSSVFFGFLLRAHVEKSYVFDHFHLDCLFGAINSH